MQYLLIVDMNF